MCLNGRKVGVLLKWRWKFRPFLFPNTAGEVTQDTAGPVPNAAVRTMACRTLIFTFQHSCHSLDICQRAQSYDDDSLEVSDILRLLFKVSFSSCLSKLLPCFELEFLLLCFLSGPTLEQGPLSTWLRDETPSFSQAARAHLWHTCCFVPALGFYK